MEQRESGIPFVVRTRLIPGVTDTEENLTAVARFLQKEQVNSIDLMRYNKVAGSKYAALEISKIINGGPLTLEIHDTTFRNEEGMRKVAHW